MTKLMESKVMRNYENEKYSRTINNYSNSIIESMVKTLNCDDECDNIELIFNILAACVSKIIINITDHEQRKEFLVNFVQVVNLNCEANLKKQNMEN